MRYFSARTDPGSNETLVSGVVPSGVGRSGISLGVLNLRFSWSLPI
jgi:hypothetical protein